MDSEGMKPISTTLKLARWTFAYMLEGRRVVSSVFFMRVQFSHAVIGLLGQREMRGKTFCSRNLSDWGISNQKEGAWVIGDITWVSCWAGIQNFIVFILGDKDGLDKGRFLIICSSFRMTVIVLMINLIMLESSKVKEFMKVLQARNDVNVTELMDVGLYLADFVVGKAILSTKYDDDEHCIWKSVTSNLVTVIPNLNEMQFGSKFCDVLHNDAIIRVTGQMIPTVEKVIYASLQSTRIRLVGPVCVVKIQAHKKNALRGEGFVLNQMMGHILVEMRRPETKQSVSFADWALEYDVIVKEKASVISKVAEPVNDAEMSSPEKPEDRRKPINSWFKSKLITYVYVNEFPVYITYDDNVKVHFKCGMVNEIPEGRNPCEKIYFVKRTRRDKGDTYIFIKDKGDTYIFIKVPSVSLYLQLLDKVPPMLGGKNCMLCTKAKFKQRKGEIALNHVDKGKVMKIAKAEHKMFGWYGPGNSKTSTPGSMAHHYAFFPAEMRAGKHICSELATNVEVVCARKDMKLDAIGKWYIRSSYMQVLVEAMHKISLNYILEDKDVLKERNMSQFELGDNFGPNI
ncbi:hypothetical protein POM88_001365 [Heracleum sosnowskyi]|uniref:Uncharacterized protein n=1 Tax=Heracleum sosnowskyi TaxID=360622 RepID=A0AAD8N4X4_9APIA|nr:hypothetical protein POM88_001365 [Heracleum sosnowskyi]